MHEQQSGRPAVTAGRRPFIQVVHPAAGDGVFARREWVQAPPTLFSQILTTIRHRTIVWQPAARVNAVRIDPKSVGAKSHLLTEAAAGPA
jgi:hypothetical protein